MKFKIPKTAAEWHHKGEHFFHMTYTGLESYYGHPPISIVALLMFIVAVIGVFIAAEGH